MPLGFQRLNERHARPNSNINFITSLPGTSASTAHDFLSRIAALMYPIMRAHHLLVNTLEEFPFNREFAGRNFNAGEVVQLVLKDKDGKWLGFRSVALVMVHELAHCRQMNHSKYFWEERNRFAEHLGVLWESGYTGEGVWGRGLEVGSGGFVGRGSRMGTMEVLSLCGGAYRGRGRKRKRSGGKEREKVSYAERQQRRIQKKFGKHGEGNALGENETVRGHLETGRASGAKPKVAGSKRGRELRAAAALARFEASADKAKGRPEEVSTEDDSGSETDSDYDDGTAGASLLDDKGQQVKDSRGNGLVKVCEGEDMGDENAQREMQELQNIDERSSSRESRAQPTKANPPIARNKDGSKTTGESQNVSVGDFSTKNESEAEPVDKEDQKHDKDTSVIKASTPAKTISTASSKTSPPKEEPPNQLVSTNTCPICSLENEPGIARCMVCAHVLDRNMVRNAWQCGSEQCVGSKYLNAGDCGVCGVCGVPKAGGKVST